MHTDNLKLALNVACIGSRDITDAPTRRFIYDLGRMIVHSNNIIHTGNAFGADELFASGGNSINPASVVLHLPWKTYNCHLIRPDNRIIDRSPDEYIEIARENHPVFNKLSYGAQKLMVRNVSIIKNADLCLAYLNHKKKNGGGTGMGVRLCSVFDIPWVDISKVRPDMNGTEEVMKFIESVYITKLHELV